jgi:hypothetical protein
MAATFTQTQAERSLIGSSISWSWADKVSEYFWFALCLILFMALGPFSAPIVLGYIFFGRISDQKLSEPDPVSNPSQL